MYLIIGLRNVHPWTFLAPRIINDYSIAFFDRLLKGASAPLMDGNTPSPYQEVTVASRHVGLVPQLEAQERRS